MKSENPDLKVVISIGGWTFPSAFWAEAVRTAESR